MIRDGRPAPESPALATTAHRPGPVVGPTVAFHSFGCKLNQCETAGIRSRFVEAGFAAVSVLDTGSAPTTSGLVVADVHVVNTCSVTGRADAQARQLVRKLIRQQPGSRVVVTGCYAQRAPEEIARIPGVFLVAGNGEKDRLHELVGGMLGEAGGSGSSEPRAIPGSPGILAVRIAVSDLRKAHRSFDLDPIDFGEKTRAFLRVQDGCDAGCTFCIIPRIRGRSSSMDIDQAVAQARAVIAAGYREIVLTGIHLGMYGRDPVRGPEPAPGFRGPSLARLIDAIHEIPGSYRLRLSSIEPQEIDDELIDRMVDGRLVPHLHVPLQSGADRILARMNRTYRADEYDAVLRRLASRVDPMGIGADVIVGFPGETDADFEETYLFIEDRPFTYLHVFPFSPRPGTRAATLPGRPQGPVVDERSARLRALSDQKKVAFARRLVGRTVEVLVEEPGDHDYWDGWSEPYVRVRFPFSAGDDLTGEMVRIEVDESLPDGTLAGRVVWRPPPD